MCHLYVACGSKSCIWYWWLLHPFNSLFSRTIWVSRYRKGKTSLDLNEAGDDGVLGWQWHQLDHMQTICTSLQTDNHTSTSSLSFNRPDALPDAQPTVSKHWSHNKGWWCLEINIPQWHQILRSYVLSYVFKANSAMHLLVMPWALDWVGYCLVSSLCRCRSQVNHPLIGDFAMV